MEIKNRTNPKISKDKSNLVAYGLVIINALILLSLPAFMSNTFPTFFQENKDKIASLYKFKEDEQKVWDSVKGVETSREEEGFDSFVETTPTTSNVATPSSSNGASPSTSTVESKIQNPTVLLMGDSMMLEGLGPELERALTKYDGVKVIRKGKYSTGLNKITYYDWFTAAEEYMKEFKPDIAIVVFGGNDGQDLIDENGKRVVWSPTSEKWKETYARRVQRFVAILEKYTKYSYWIGHPMTDSSDFGPKLSIMNSIYKAETAKSSKVFFVDPSERFSPGGVYSPYVADDEGLKQLAKTSDGVHLTLHGGKVLSSLVVKMMKEKVELV